MIASIGSNVSALKACGVEVEVTAHNVANVNTDGFSKRKVVPAEGANGEVKAVISRSAAEKTAEVDLVEEISGLIPTQKAYEANLKTIKTRDELTGVLIDLIG